MRDPWPCSLALLAALAAVPGCYEGYDRLDPDRLAEIIRSRGDAEGIARSGLYRGSFSVLSCGCDELATTFDVTLCSVVAELESFGLDDRFEVVVIQADGTVRITAQNVQLVSGLGEPLTPAFYGSLDADGTVEAAGILQSDALLVEGQVLGRVDGTLDEQGLRAELNQRYSLTTEVTPPNGDASSEAANVDCREWIELDLVLDGPVPPPAQE